MQGGTRTLGSDAAGEEEHDSSSKAVDTSQLPEPKQKADGESTAVEDDEAADEGTPYVEYSPATSTTAYLNHLATG